MLKEIQITEQPVSACVPADYTLTLRCKAESALSLQYQWYQKSVHYETPCCQIPGATQPELRITARESHLYVCRVHDQHRNVQFSRWVKVKVYRNITTALLPAQWQGEPIIVINPSSVTVRTGTTVHLKCSALGIPAPDYQWYHHGQPLDRRLRKELCIKAVKMNDSGCYLCCVTNDRGEQWSDPAEITIAEDIVHKTPLLPPSPAVTPVTDVCYATDKVALLVGNNNYVHHPNLLAPMMDVYEFSILLKRLNFRVVSLLDLTKSEMLTAVKQFLQLLGKGVYGLFYYAGHGYERPGRNYMVPIDAPQPYQPENCISVQNILHKMQARQTALNVVLLDTCRKWYNPKCPLSEVRPLEPMGNTVCGYATSEDAEAYEVQDGELSSGIFMKYLKKHILKEKKITHVLDEVLEDIGRDPLVLGKQVMEIKHTLKEPRALTDKICTTGHTGEFRARNELWFHASELPKQTVTFSCGVEIELTFQAVFSNLMHVYAKVKQTPPSMADIRVLLYKPLEMIDLFKLNDSRSERVDSLLASTSRVESDCMLRLCGLQKCQNDVIIKIDLHYTGLNTRQRAQESLHHNLKMPLVAKMFIPKNSDTASTSSANAASYRATASSSSCASEDQGAAAMYSSNVMHQPAVNTGSTVTGTAGADNRPNLLFTGQSKMSSEPEENDESDTLFPSSPW